MQEGLKKEIWEQSKEWIDAVSQVVNEMASKLGVASEHIYKIYTKQMFYEGLMEVVSSILFSALVIVLFYYLSKFLYRTAEKTADGGYHVFNLILGIAVLLTVSFQLNDIRVGAMMMFNPEYYTMKDLLDSVKVLVDK